MSGNREYTGKVFPPFKRATTIAGVPLPHLWRVGAALVLGIALFFALGTFKTEADKPLSSLEAVSAQTQLEELRDAAIAYERMSEAAGTDDPSKLDMSPADAALAEQARAKGITSSTTDAQIKAMAPASKKVEVEAVSPVLRGATVLLLFAFAFAYHTELGRGWSIHTQTKRIAKYLRRQRVFASRRKSYIDGKDAR